MFAAMKRCLVLIGVGLGLLALAGCGSTGETTTRTGIHLTAAKVRAHHRAARKTHRKAHRRHVMAVNRAKVRARHARHQARIRAREAATRRAHRAEIRQAHRDEREERELAAAPEESECDPNYSGACLMPNVSDYDCEGGSGNGPYYTGEVMVVGVDHYGLDADGDGIGCEPY
jgi:hypothetical protein